MQLLTSLAPSGTQVGATLYYADALPGTTSPHYRRATSTLQFWKTIGAYNIYTGYITEPSHTLANGGGFRAIDVIKLGSTLKSAKLEVETLHGDPIKACSNADMTTCP